MHVVSDDWYMQLYGLIFVCYDVSEATVVLPDVNIMAIKKYAWFHTYQSTTDLRFTLPIS